MRRANHLRRRGAFTLVELLIVITILGIMFALTAAAVVRALGKGDEVKVRSELSQLTAAVKAFQQEFGVSYLPDTLTLPPGNDQQSRQYISSLWPRLRTGTGGVSLLDVNAQSLAYWQTNGQQRVLRGHQTLVFFVGGYREGFNPGAGVVGDPIGFSSDTTDPMKASTSRKGPYYEFPSDRIRLIVLPEPVPSQPFTAAMNPFPGFKDIYGAAPYLYFSSASGGNDYTTTPTVVSYLDDTKAPQNKSVSPFKLKANRFANPSGFQIISAGRDTRFGAGDVNWAGGTGITGNNKDGIDDMANFHSTQLGIAGN